MAIKARVSKDGETVSLVTDAHTANRMLALLRDYYINEVGICIAGEMLTNTTDAQRRELAVAFGEASKQADEVGTKIMCKHFAAKRRKP
jgi:hypothetical protein